jgi:fatty-acyl-CoA synthase
MRNQGLGSWIARRARRAPERTALVFEDSSWSYGELRDRIYRLAHGLASLGVRTGDRVGYLGPNHPSFVETMFACGALGAIFVPINYRLAGPEIAYILGDAGCDALVYGSELAPTVDAIRSQVPVRSYLAVGEARGQDIDFEALLAGQADEPVDEPVGLDDVCLIAYTSGTTGRPKGVMLTHGNLTWNVHNYLSCVDLQGEDVSLTFSPLYRLGALGVTVLPVLWKGATMVLMAAPREDRALELVWRHRVTVMFGGPDIFASLARASGWAEADLSSVRICVCGGAPVPEPLIRAYLERGIPFLQGYGLTEAASMVLLLDRADMLRKVGSAGTPPLYGEVRVVRPDMTDVGPGEAGEIVYRGPNVMKGYWNRPEATEEAITHGGWLHTGDVARMDEEGYLYIVDRLKDAYSVGGENVFPAEVERALKEHPAVEDAAVVGVPDARTGEMGVAFVVLREGAAATPGELLRFCAERLAEYKVPRAVELVDDLPRNPSGKVLKRELRERATRGRPEERAA